MDFFIISYQTMPKAVVFFKEVDHKDIWLVWGKIASLATMIQWLTDQGVRVPDGFWVTTHAYDLFLAHNNINTILDTLYDTIDPNDMHALQDLEHKAHALIMEAQWPTDVKEDIFAAYQTLSTQYSMDHADVAIRSSATAEDSPGYSFAWQQETYLNIMGDEAVLHHIQACFASLFTAKAISYRKRNGFGNEVKIAVAVQKMVRADLAGSGVAFSIDPESGFDKVVTITSWRWLGELIVWGQIHPDEYFVHKETMTVIDKKIYAQDLKMIYKHAATQTINIPLAQQYDEVLSEDELITLASYVKTIETYFTSLDADTTAVDVEWAKDGQDGHIYIVQARPETVHSQEASHVMKEYRLLPKQEKREHIHGIAVGKGIAHGTIQCIHSFEQRASFVPWSVLVTDMTDPNREPIMKQASAIVTNRWGRTCHAAIIARELGIPAVIGTNNATKILEDGQEVTVSCCEWHTWYVYEGHLAFGEHQHDLSALNDPQVPIQLIVVSPDKVFEFWKFPHAWVWLARMEFIINNSIGIHPLALLNYDKLTQSHKSLSDEIAGRIDGYTSPKDYFIQKLTYGLARICGAFYPHDVVVRFSDFKSNEYAKLLWGELYEPEEENPMLWRRWASRYYDPTYKEAFLLECEAIKKVREHLKMTNMKVMIPFCRTIDEAHKVLALMKEGGLVQGEHGLEVYMMCEIPANIFLADKFIEIFDGFSIGSNDLTQLILWVDRDSGKIADLFDEQNEAIKRALHHVISTVRKAGKKIGICGQGPSDYPAFAQFLVDEGISAISVNADVFVQTVESLS